MSKHGFRSGIFPKGMFTVTVMVLWVLFSAPVIAGENPSPVDGFKNDLRRALAIRYDPALQLPETIDRQKQQIWALIDSTFNEDLIIPLILQRTWPELTTEEKIRLRPVFRWVIKWKFIGKLYKYNVQEVSFNGEGIDGDRYVLKARIGTGLLSHPVRFIFYLKNDRWAAVDMIIRNLSLVSHYRRKFDDTFFKSGLNGLLKHLTDEVNEEFEEMGYNP